MRTNSAKFIAEVLLCLWIASFSLGITKTGPIPIKTIILLLFLLFTPLALIKKKHINLNQKWSLIIVFIWIYLSICIGTLNGFDSSTASQAASLISTFLAVIFAIILNNNTPLNIKKIEKTIQLTAATGIATKIFIGLGVISGYFSADAVDQAMQNYVGSASFNVDVFGGFLGLLPRIGNAGDLFYLIIFLFYAKKYEGGKVALAWVATLLFTLISYSRYLMIFFALSSFYIAILSTKRKPKGTILIFAIALLIADLSHLDPGTLFLEIENRFTGQIQYESDSIRSEMKEVIATIFYSNIFWGIGIGGYAHNYLRSPTNLWQYELEYLSLLMQLGLFGFLFIVINYSIFVIRSIFHDYQKYFILPMIMSTTFFFGTPIQSSIFCGTQSALIILSIFFLSRRNQNLYTKTQTQSDPFLDKLYFRELKCNNLTKTSMQYKIL